MFFQGFLREQSKQTAGTESIFSDQFYCGFDFDAVRWLWVKPVASILTNASLTYKGINNNNINNHLFELTQLINIV